MHICVGKLTIIGSDNGSSPIRHQAIIQTNVGILLIGPIGTNFSEMLIKIHIFSFKKIHLKMSSGKWWPFCLGLNMLRVWLEDVVEWADSNKGGFFQLKAGIYFDLPSFNTEHSIQNILIKNIFDPAFHHLRIFDFLWIVIYQSGTKPNLVAKIWPPNLVTICAWLPILVASVNSNFHHLVNTGLAVGSFFQMATNNGSPHLQIRHNLSGLYLADWKWLHPIAITFNTLCLVKFYIQWCGALQWTRWRSYLKQLICLCLAS